MTLSQGTRLGAYEIGGPLGAGGMGEVWRARDSRLGRDVAIKALPETFARDPDRLARFEREARLLASLSHPNIAGIHGLEEVDGRRYLVLEYVEGDTLAGRIARGPLPLDEALEVCRQIASAVEAAHENGVIHRDLKPANVKLTPAGEVKVLDFGLAKGTPAADSSGIGPATDVSQSPTVALSMTGAGVILGTAAYMSPEQARGKPVDRRTDIWSFGCVLFECLTGRQLFEGETVSDLIAKILEREPDWSALPGGTPPRVQDLLRRCLDKDAKRRMRDIGDARIELEEAIAARASASRSDVSVEAAAAAARKARPAVAWLAWGLVAVLGAATAVLGIMQLRSAGVSAPPVRFPIEAPHGTTLLSDGSEFAISPDGRTVAFIAADSSGTGHLWLRTLDSHTPRRLAGTDNPTLPFWSPDGRWIAFFADGKLKKTPSAGGTVETLAEANNGRGGAWNRDGVIVFAPAGAGPIFKIGRPGDSPVAVTTLDTTRSENGHRYPCFLPDGKHFLYAALPPRQGRYDVLVGSIDGAPPRMLGAFDACPVHAEPGHLLFLRGQTIHAQRFDARALRLRGEPVSLGETPAPTIYSGGPSLSVARGGALLTMRGTLPNTEIFPYDRAGRRGAALPLPAARYEGMEFSPDGQRAVLLRVDDRASQDLWMYEFARGTLSRFTYGPGRKANPSWSPDGRYVAYSSDQEGPWDIHAKSVGGSGEEIPLLVSPTPFKYPGRWASDSRTLVVEALEEKTGWDLSIVSLDDPEPVPYLRTPFNERWGSISPDGRWMAYTSDESGKSEVYVQRYPVAADKHQISTSGGVYALWGKDGRELMFFSPETQRLMTVDVRTEPPFSVGVPRALMRLPQSQGGAITPDFEHMFLILPTEANLTPALNVLLNWETLASRKTK